MSEYEGGISTAEQRDREPVTSGCLAGRCDRGGKRKTRRKTKLRRKTKARRKSRRR